MNIYIGHGSDGLIGLGSQDLIPRTGTQFSSYLNCL